LNVALGVRVLYKEPLVKICTTEAVLSL